MTDKHLGPGLEHKCLTSDCDCVYQCVGSLCSDIFGLFCPCTEGQGGKGKHNYQGNPTTEWKLEMNTAHAADL